MIPFALPLQAKLATAGISALLLIGTAVYLYSHGKDAGVTETKTEWALDTARREAAINELRLKYSRLQVESTQENTRISDDLIHAREQARADLDAAAVAHGKRLLVSQERGAVYQRLAEAGPTERTGLASHAAKLDRALEEGRSVVAELGITLGQREEELKLLGAQITSDRKLMGE